MKKIVYLIGFMLTVLSFSLPQETFAKDFKYKVKLKGAAARAYVRNHHYGATRTRTVGYRSYRSSHARTTAYRHTAHRTYARHTAYRGGYRYSRTASYAGYRHRPYRRYHAASYSGYRHSWPWNKVKIKRSDDKAVYKYKR